MTDWPRNIRVLLGAAALVGLAACSSTGPASYANTAQDEQLAPVNNGNVQTGALPPIGPNGEVAGPTADPLANPAYGQTETTTANADGSFQTLPPVGTLPNSSGRDLSGGLTVEKLLGGWTVVSGGDQCKLNLTQTAKTGTSRYRASAPACALKGLSLVASWQLAGSQVQLFDDGGTMIAALILSGNRFIGTLSGGTGISMVG